MYRVHLSLLLLLSLLASCKSSTAPEAEILHGHWRTEFEALSPAGSMQYHLILGPGRRFSAEVRSYGLYSTHAAADLSAFARHEGKFRVEGSRIIFQPEILVSWDSFHGVAHPTVTKPSPYQTLYDEATFAVGPDHLTLHYFSYPADAAVATQQTFRRAEP